MLRFPSIKKNADFQRVYRKGRPCANALIVLYVLKGRGDAGDSNRLGVSCSKKVGNSVLRHTITRRLREIFRGNKQRLAKGLDIVVVVRKGAGDYSYKSLERAYLDLCRKQGIIKNWN